MVQRNLTRLSLQSTMSQSILYTTLKETFTSSTFKLQIPIKVNILSTYWWINTCLTQKYQELRELAIFESMLVYEL